MTEVLFKSGIGAEFRFRGYFFIGISCIFLIPSIYYFYQMTTTLFEDIYFFTFRFAGIFFLIISLIIFWLALQFLGSYLIIYQDGIKVRKPYRLFRHKFINWSDIKNIEYFDRGVIMDDEDVYPYNTIRIYLKDQIDSIEISNIWVNEIKEAYDRMRDFISIKTEPENCAYHPSIKKSKKCMICGKNVCSGCIEEKSIFGTYSCECSLCLFNKAKKRMKITLIISIIFPIYYIYYSILFLFIPPPIEYTLFQAADATPIFIFIIAIILTPYAYGLLLSNIKRRKILDKLGVHYNYLSFLILNLLTIFTILFYSILFYSINVFLALVFAICAGIYTIIVYGYNKPRKYTSTPVDFNFGINKTKDKFDIHFLYAFLIFYSVVLGLYCATIIWNLFLKPPEISEDLLWLIIKTIKNYNP